MPVTSNRKITINWADDVEYTQEFEASVNPLGSGQNQLVDLASGANTITVPANAIGVTIIPPANNAVAILLKKVTGDTGIALSLLDPCSLSLAGVTSFVLTAADVITGVRLIYS